MPIKFNNLQNWLDEIAHLLKQDIEPPHISTISFLQDANLSLQLIDIINKLAEEKLEQLADFYSACIYAVDICIVQLQAASENGNKSANKILKQLMSHLAQTIIAENHSLSFWLPILNTFYDAHVELSDELQQAYMELTDFEDEQIDDDVDHLAAMRDMIADMDDLSAFDIADNFFAQSHAMPADFLADLVIDLYSIDEGHEIGLLTLLHPKAEVRGIVVTAIEQLIKRLTLSSVSLSRLEWIKNCYPKEYHAQFDRWIRIQRMKGVTFSMATNKSTITQIQASEIDGSGAQGVFIHLKQQGKVRICGLLFKQGAGIKDSWVTPPMSTAEVEDYYTSAFKNNVYLRHVNEHYLILLCQHFFALTIQQGKIPNLHFLEIQELINLYFKPQLINISALMEQLTIQISPFTPEAMHLSLKRSQAWINNKRFTESWYIENALVDKLVNRCSSFVEGTRVCLVQEAVNSVFAEEMEKQRERWFFHFLWTALWLKACTKKNEKAWQDSLFIAYAIYTGKSLNEIPIMREISKQTVINSIETMNERGTHLN